MTRRVLIGIAGGSGSGKTLVARNILRELGSDKVVVIDQDSYYRNLEDVPFRDREARNFDHPDAFDGELLKQHIRELLDGKPVEQPIYDYAEHRRLEETRRISDHLVVVLDTSASMSARPGLAASSDAPSFAQQAAERVRAEIGALPSGSRVTLVRSGARPSILSGPAAFPEEALVKLEGYPELATAGRHDLESATSLALQLAGDGAVTLFTGES